MRYMGRRRCQACRQAAEFGVVKAGQIADRQRGIRQPRPLRGLMPQRRGPQHASYGLTNIVPPALALLAARRGGEIGKYGLLVPVGEHVLKRFLLEAYCPAFIMRKTPRPLAFG